MSVVGDLFNFGRHSIIQEDDAIDATIPLTRGPRILHLVQHKDIIAFCENAEVVIKPQQGNALTYKTISTEFQSYMGTSARNPPLVCGNAVLFVDAAGASVREFKYDYTLDALAGKDISVMNSELLAGASIVDWCYQMFPESVVWCVLSDGRLAALTYMPEQEVYAWHTHGLATGRVAGVCCTEAILDDGKTSEMFALVERADGGRALLAMRAETDAARFADEPAQGVAHPVACRFVGLVPDTEKGELNGAIKRIVDVRVRVAHGEKLKAGSVNDVGDTEAMDALAVEATPRDAGLNASRILTAQVRGGYCREPRVVLADDSNGALEILSLTTGVDVQGRD